MTPGALVITRCVQHGNTPRARAYLDPVGYRVSCQVHHGDVIRGSVRRVQSPAIVGQAYSPRTLTHLYGVQYIVSCCVDGSELTISNPCPVCRPKTRGWNQHPR